MTNPILKERIKLLNLQQFAEATYPGPFQMNLNRTTDFNTEPDGSGNVLSPEAREFYSDFLLDNAEPYLAHGLFGQRQRKPRGTGTDVVFRGYNPYPKALVPLQEGVTPDGRKPTMRQVRGTLHQYGDYTTLTDRVMVEHPDNHLMQITKLHGQQMGRTIDTIYREVLNGGTNVQYGASAVLARHLLVGGEQTGNHYLTVDCIRRAVRFLKSQNADKIDGSYVAIIHQDCSYDLMSDPEWKYPHQYQDTTEIYEGEIGRIAGARFVETTEAKVFHAEDLCAAARNLTVKTAVSSSTTVAITQALTASDVAAIKGRYVLIGGSKYKVTGATAGAAGSASIVVDANVSSAAANSTIYPGEAGAKGRDVYSTLILGDNAYGIVDIDGENAQTITKQLGSGGTSDPLDQRGSTGWKASALCLRLTEAYMVRIETASTFELGEAN